MNRSESTSFGGDCKVVFLYQNLIPCYNSYTLPILNTFMKPISAELTKRITALESHMHSHECQIELLAQGVHELNERMAKVEKKIEQTATKHELNKLTEKIQTALDALAL